MERGESVFGEALNPLVCDRGDALYSVYMPQSNSVSFILPLDIENEKFLFYFQIPKFQILNFHFIVHPQ